MSGHSKWHSIKHKKGAADAKRGKIFTKHAKLIAIAAKHGPDPDTNPGLRAAIDGAKTDNVPNMNIERAIKKGSGQDKDATTYEEIFYEGTLEDLTEHPEYTEKITKPVLFKFEKVRILGIRAKQLQMGAKPLIKNVLGLTSKEIAQLELKEKIIPFIIERTLPNGQKEKFKLSELSVPE